MRESIMVKLKASDDFIIFRVVIKDRKKRKEFYIRRDKLLSLREEKHFSAHDGNFAVFHADEGRDELIIRFYWLNLSSETFTGRMQTVLLPLTDTLCFAEESVFESGEKTKCVLAKNPNRRPRLIFHSRKTLAEVAANKFARHKLAKALSKNFNWPSSAEIHFYDDFVPYSFLFREFCCDREGIVGGLILSGQKDIATAAYSVHT